MTEPVQPVAPAQSLHAGQADSHYAEELDARFQQLMQWAIDNWPVKELPLQVSDFMASRKEIDGIRGTRVSESRIAARGNTGGDAGRSGDNRAANGASATAPASSADNSAGSRSGDGQFFDVTPMPWP